MPTSGPWPNRVRALRLVAPVALAGLGLVPGCVELPAWETYFTIPLVSDTVCPIELFDSTLFRMTDSSVDLHVELDFDTVHASDSFGRFSIADMFVFPLGAFTLPRVTAVAAGYAIWDVRGIQPSDSFIGRFGHYVREYRFEFPLPGVDSVLLGGGVIEVRVDNRTRVPLHRVKLEFTGIRTRLLGMADTMAQTGFRLDLAGVRLGETVAGRLVLISLGTGENEVLLCHADSVLVELAVDSVRLQTGWLRPGCPVPVLVDAGYSRTLVMDQRLVVDSALFSQGDIVLTFGNTLSVGVELDFAIRELGFDSCLVVAADTTTVCEIELSGRCFSNPDQDSIRLTTTVTARLLPAAEPVTVSETQELRVDVLGSGLRTAYIHATARDTVWTKPTTQTVRVEQPQRFARMRLTGLWLNARARSTLGFPGVMEVTVAAETRSGDSTEVRLVADLPPGSPEEPSFGDAVAEATRLLGVEAERLRFSARFGLTRTGSISYPSWTTSSALLAAPLRVQLLADTVCFGPWSLPIPSTVRSKPGQELLGGELVVPVTGRFPFRMKGLIRLVGEKGNRLQFEMAVPSAVMDPKRGVTVAPRDSVLVFEFGEEAQAIFKGREFDVEFDLVLPRTDTVLVTPADHFRIDESYARVKMRLGRK